MLITSDAEGGTYELYLIPKDAASGREPSPVWPSLCASKARAVGLLAVTQPIAVKACVTVLNKRTPAYCHFHCHFPYGLARMLSCPVNALRLELLMLQGISYKEFD